ncbi:MAG: amidohydrolase family protein [Opitutae bacterium]|nr:amidohydrolase family protein [Opitutae bacterium]
MRIDGHVHFVGDGSNGSGCWLRSSTLLDRIVEPIVKAQAGILKSSRQLSIDQAYEQRLIGLIDDSSLDAVLLLAMDYPYDEDGNCLKEKAKFYVPNDHVFRLAKKYAQIIPACSIHPARKDAIEELERCAEEGAKVLKLLPNCHNVDCSDNRYRAFWEKLAKLNMPFLAHTGGEFSVPVLNTKFADPRILGLPLECGVKVIAAHGAGKSGLWDPDYTADLLRMMDQFANLFTDNSALASPNRWRTIPALLDPKIQPRVIHGSDFPIPSGGFGPWMGNLLNKSDYFKSRKIKNPLERDVFIKKAIGFKENTFTVLGKILA